MLILMIISALVFGALMFCTKVQAKTRKRNTDYWNNVPWVDAGKPKWTRLSLILVCVVCLIPVVNIILAGVAIINFCTQLNSPRWDEGVELIYKRLVFKNIVTDWLMEEI